MANKRKRVVVTADMIDKQALMLAIESQGNAIPVEVATVIRLVAPIIARLVIRYVARKVRRKVSDATVNTASQWIGNQVGAIIDRASRDSKKE